MIILFEKLANLIGRPFGLDFFFETTCRLHQVTGYQWGYAAPEDKLDSHKVWFGPLHLAMCTA